MPNKGIFKEITPTISDRLNATLMQFDTLANRPAAGQRGRLFAASDTGDVFYDDGTAWGEMEAVVPGDVIAIW